MKDYYTKRTYDAMGEVFAYMRRMMVQRISGEEHPDDVESGDLLKGWEQDVVDRLVTEARTLMALLDDAMKKDKESAPKCEWCGEPADAPWIYRIFGFTPFPCASPIHIRSRR